MNWRLLLIGAICSCLWTAGVARAVSIALNVDGQGEVFAAEVGQEIEVEVVVDAGVEAVSGATFFISFDSAVFRLLAAEAEHGEPFVSGTWLEGIVLLNRAEEVGGETVLGFALATGVQRGSASGQGVLARFRLQVERRPEGDLTSMRIEERGHERSSHYLLANEPGREWRFAAPLGHAMGRISGFRILPLPDVELVEGTSRTVFDLDDFVGQEGAQVIWSHSRLAAVSTAIDLESNEVTLGVRPGIIGEFSTVFTAFEIGEGLTVSDTVQIRVLAPPQIVDFPAEVVFAEDGLSLPVVLDDLVEDRDTPIELLTWHASGGNEVQVEIDAATRRAVFSALPDWFGVQDLHFEVIDIDGLRDSVSTRVVVDPVNDAPVAQTTTPVYPVVGQEGVFVPLSALAVDIDNEIADLTFALEAAEEVTATVVADQLSIVGQIAGRAAIYFDVSDASGALDRGRQIAVVLPAGTSRGPQIERLPLMRFRSGQGGLLALESFVEDDAPAQQLQWRAAASSGLSAALDAGQLRVDNQDGFVGLGEVLLTVEDPQGNRDTAKLAVEVLDLESAGGPRIAAAAQVGVVAGGAVGIALDRWVDDPDYQDAEIQWHITTSEGLQSELEGRVLNLRASDAASGLGVLQLRAENPDALADEVSVPVLIVAAGGAPLLRDWGEIVLESSADTVEIDLDEFVFDDRDTAAELLWSAVGQPGVAYTLDPVGHRLRLFRDDEGGTGATQSQVLLQVLDTDGLQSSGVLLVGLPPLFELAELPAVEFFADEIDSSLVLGDFVVVRDASLEIAWTVEAGPNVMARFEPASGRLHLQAENANFAGIEHVRLLATDPTQRSRQATVEVTVKSRGLGPTLRPLPRLQILDGQVEVLLALDDFVDDDNPADALEWTALGDARLTAEVDPSTRILKVGAIGPEPGSGKVRLTVADPEGNSAVGLLEVVIVRGGEAPRLETLPRIILNAGGPEAQIGLDPYISDAETPDEQIVWELSAGVGVVARLEARQVFVSVPAGQVGTRSVMLSAMDADGNQVEGELQVLIVEDGEVPRFAVNIVRHPVFNDQLELHVRVNEPLSAVPEIRADGAVLAVEMRGEQAYSAAYQVPARQGERAVNIAIDGSDLGGNRGGRLIEVALRWMDRSGGTLKSRDGQVVLEVPDEAAGPGRLALIYRLAEEDVPPDSEGQSVYSIDLVRGRQMEHPVTLRFLQRGPIAADSGIVRWDEAAQQWQGLPTTADEARGWLAVSTRQLSFYRIGSVSPGERTTRVRTTNFPNPFPSGGTTSTQIVYELLEAGPVKLRVFNALGQVVRVLVDESFRGAGVWSASWDGYDEAGRILSSGIYFYELSGDRLRLRGSMLLMR